jgi:hypothetical protein
MDRSLTSNSGCHLQNKAYAADTTIRVLDINSDHVTADRQFDVWYIDAGWLHEWLDA